MPQPRFRDRKQAGEQLGQALGQYRGEDALVLGMARGGVPVAAEVARAIAGELDVLVARKLGVPHHPEFGFGAIAMNAEYVDQDTVATLDLAHDEIERVKERERAEMTRRGSLYRGKRAAPRIYQRTVIVVDDGVATGGTAIAALEGVRKEGPSKLVFAAPVGPRDALDLLRDHADDVVILRTPEPFQAVGMWYDRFDQTSDDEVLDLIAHAKVRETKSLPREVAIGVRGGHVGGTLTVPPNPIGLVIFAHGSGSSRRSPRNQYVARVMNDRGLATLLMDLLTPQEEAVDEVTREHRFDIPLLARRLVRAAEWSRAEADIRSLGVGYFGSSTGGGAALVAAAADPASVRAVVSRGGRPDLARDALPHVEAPTLLIVGERDEAVIDLNAEAKERMTIEAKIHIVPGATHLFEEPGALEEVAGIAADWFAKYLPDRAVPRTQEEARHG